MLALILELLKALPAAIVTGVIVELIVFWFLRVINKEKSLPSEPLKRWIIGVSRATVIAFYFFGLIIFFNEKWAVTTTTAVIVFVASALGITAFEFIPLSLGHAYRQETRSPKQTDLSLFREVIFLTIFLTSLTWLLDRFMPHYVSFICPSEVTSEEVVEGLIAKPNWHVRVLVHSIADDKLWVQNIPVVDQKGTWRVSCLFGGGDGGVFELLALASSDSLALEVGDQVRPDQIPKTARLSKICLTKKRNGN